MKIVKLRSYALSAELDEPFFFSQHGTVTHRSAVIVELETDTGIIGWGESMCHGLQPPGIAKAVLDDVLHKMLVGRDVEDIAVFHEEASNRLRDFGRQGATFSALSAVDIAMWDILGQASGQPVWRVLGGAFRRVVRPYATGFYRTSQRGHHELAREAEGHLEAGFTAMKVKVGFGISDDVALLRKIREVVGPDVLLMADANHAYNASAARQLLLQCEDKDIDLYWLEEPIPPEDLDGYQELRNLGGSTLIAAGESECGAVGFWPWAKSRMVDIFQPDLAMTGGFTTMRQIGWMAQAAGVSVNPHVWGTAIGLTAALHAIAALPPAPSSRGTTQPLLEYDSSAHPFRRELIAEPATIVDGVVEIPDRPGLGITVNRAVLERYSVSGIQ